MEVRVDVLGGVRVVGPAPPGRAGGTRQRQLLGRLVAARGRAVPLAVLVDDLWDDDAPARAEGAVRTFAADLRRALEPDRPARAAPRVLLTVGTGYALRLPREAVDAHRYEDAVAAARTAPPEAAAARVAEAEEEWRGEPYADLPASAWVDAERDRLQEVRLQAAEVRAQALLGLGRAGEVVAELGALARARPERGRVGELLALALYRAGRQEESLAVLRRARARLRELGLEPGAPLVALEQDVLRRAPHLDLAAVADGPAPLLAGAGAAAGATAGSASARARLRSSVEALRHLAVAGGDDLRLAQEQRLAAAREAERTGDVELVARVVAAYDVPTVWTRPDDPAGSAQLVALARRTLARLGPDAPAVLRSRLLATAALEHRGTRDAWAADAAREAEALARAAGDPGAVVLALDARFVQSFQQPGAAAARRAIGAELVEVAVRHDLPTFEILGHLVLLQACAALGDAEGADAAAAAAEARSASYDSPLVPVLTAWYRALRAAAPPPPEALAALAGAGMPGLADGLPAVAQLADRLRRGRPAPTDPALAWGRYAPWARPLVQLAAGEAQAARRSAAALPEPDADHAHDLLWGLAAHAAVALGDGALAARAAAALQPYRGQVLGAGTGLVALGPADELLARLAAAGAPTR